MAPKSTAEQGKKYRQKHEEVYREKNALRTRNYGQWIIANEERLQAQREKKKYRQIQPAQSHKNYDFFVHPTLSIRHYDLPLFLTLHCHDATFSS